MGTSSQYYVVELPLRIGDEESRRLAMAFEFGIDVRNVVATLLGCEWNLCSRSDI